MLRFEKIETNIPFTYESKSCIDLFRTKVPGGWLIVMRELSLNDDAQYSWAFAYGGMTFIPDPAHTWDGTSIG